MDERITIIEGPPPTFEAISDGWAMGLNESPTLGDIALTRLRTFNGPQLLERCHRAWRNHEGIYLDYRNEEGNEQSAPIVAARTLETDDGHLLLLWVRLNNDEVEVELGFDDDNEDDDEEDDLGPLEL